MNEKISNKLLAIPVAISFIIIALFCFFCIGLNNVDAKSYYWDNAYWLSFSNSQTPGSGTLHSCSNAYSCMYGNNGDYVANYFSARYEVSSNTSNNDTVLEEGEYQVKIRFRLVALDTLNSNNTIVKLYYYPNNNNAFGLATCDGTETKKITYNNNTDNDIYVDYSCSKINITRSNISYFGVSVGSTPNTLFLGQMSTQLQLIGEGEKTNQDIIDNQNQNTQDIINNQNQNQNQTNQGLQDIEDTLTDETAPNLDAFNDMSGWLPPGPLDSVLNIPLNILNGLVGAFSNNSCSPIRIPIPFIGGNLELPCLYNLYSTINGLSVVLTTFFTAISGYLMFKYLSNLYVWIDQTLKMEESSYMRDWGGV